MGRPGQPAEVAPAFVFLASEVGCRPVPAEACWWRAASRRPGVGMHVTPPQSLLCCCG